MPTRPKAMRLGPARPRKSFDKNRPSAVKRGYDYAWQRFRKQYLATHPLCRHCEQAGRTTAATEIDHITAMAKGGDKYEPDNLQPLCKACHSRKTAKEDRGGRHG